MSDVTPPPMDTILRVHRDAIGAIAEISGRFGDDDWGRPTPCEAWTARDLAGHVVTAAIMWHEALDDAEAGVSAPRCRWNEMARHNDEYLAALPDTSGPERIDDFVDRAHRWCDRVSHTDPDLPIPVAVQDVCPTPLTVSLFAWLGGVEFHLHAWDFAQAIGEDYTTPHAPTIFDARAALFGTASDGRFGVTVDGGDPWDQIIQRSRA